MIKQTKSKLTQCVDFLTADIWRIQTRKIKGQKVFWIRQLRIVLLAIRGFAEDQCQLRASALTFYSLLSIVPVVAMAFGIAKGFGFERMLEQQLREKMYGQEEVINRVILFANSFLENTKGGLIAGIGVAVLFYTVIKVLGNIEHSFNDIWGIKKGRAFGRKFSDYLSIMLICPILLIMSSSATVLIASQITLLVEKLSFLGPVADLIIFSLKILPYMVIWIVFSFVYIFMPNTEVKFRSGVMAGVIAGTIYQLVQFIYINFQVGVSKYGAIYGSFAALPLFLIWLQVSWLIVLFGAEVSFAEQNVETYEFEPDCLKVSVRFKQYVALCMTYIAVKKFYQAQQPLTADEIARELEMPIRLVREILFDLTEAFVLAEVKVNDGKTLAYQPAYDIEHITIQDVLDKLELRGVSAIPMVETPELIRLRENLTKFHDLLKVSEPNSVLKDLCKDQA